jgi:RHS repeat-associated protein
MVNSLTANDQISHATWSYDVNGRLVEKRIDKGGYRPLEWHYRWDARSQLTGLETPDGERWEYKYDPFGRRISKRCINRNKPGMHFHWNGDQLTEEIPVSPDGIPEDENAIRWIYEPGSFTPLARYEKGQLHYSVTDTVGRIQELMTEDGTIVWRGQQQLWGREEGINQEAHPRCRLRFPGQYEDEESGLYYNRFRYYDCGTGQYLSADPIGLLGGFNPYGYVHNPLGWVDPLGLAGWQIDGDKTTAILQGGPFKEKYYKDGRTGLWWSKDTTGHGGSAYKVYRETSTSLEWIADADENGQFMPDKHKGNTGRCISKKGCKGIK